MKIGVAGVPGAWSTERMADALRQAGAEAFVFSLGDCLHDLTRGCVSLKGKDLALLDVIVVKKLASEQRADARARLHLLRALEQRGVRMFSTPAAIDGAMDRYAMTMKLIEGGLPVPRTFSFEGESALVEATRAMPSAVIKPIYTSKGRGMVRLGDDGDRFLADGWRPRDGRVLLQQFVEAPGRDIGACVLGGEFAGAFYRVAAAGQWMTTTSSGGTYAACELSAEGIEIAERAARLFGLAYTVVDLVETNDGFAVYEVSAFGGFRGLWEAARRDIARDYAAYVLDPPRV